MSKYQITVPPTEEQGSYKTIVDDSYGIPGILIARKCKNRDVEIWSDASIDHQPIMVFEHYLSNKPDYRHKYIMYNCVRYNLMWDRRV